MAPDDLADVGHPDPAVPDALGVDDHRASLLAVVEAAGFVGADRIAEAALVQRILEGLEQRFAALLRARAARVVGAAVVQADEDVLLKRRGHGRTRPLRGRRGKPRRDPLPPRSRDPGPRRRARGGKPGKAWTRDARASRARATGAAPPRAATARASHPSAAAARSRRPRLRAPARAPRAPRRG